MKLYHARNVTTKETLKTNKDLQFYTSIGACKAATKNHLKRKNKYLNRGDRLRFEDYEIVEYSLEERRSYEL